MIARSVFLGFLVSLAALAGTLLGGTPARAAAVHEFLRQLPAEVPATGPHGEAVPHPGPLREAGGLAFDSGNLYIADTVAGGTRFDEFEASAGAFVQQFPELELPLYDFRQSVAVGHGTGETELYNVGDEEVEHGAVAVTDVSGKLQKVWKGEDTPSKGFGCFQCSPYDGSVAVDNSGGPDHGDVYVVDEEHGVVDVFKPLKGGEEEYLTQLTGPEQEFNPSLHFAGAGPHGVAVSQFNGDVFVIDGQAVDVFEPTLLGGYTPVRRLTGTPGGAFGEKVTHVTVDGGNGDIYVSLGESTLLIDQFAAEGEYLGQLTESPAGTLVGPGDLAVDPATHDLYVVAHEVESENGQNVIDVFGPNIVVPSVFTEEPANLAPTSATLNGKVNPSNGGEATCWFVWGTSKSFGHVAPCEPEAVGEGGVPVPVHAKLTGLVSDTTYYYRLEAKNGADGRTNVGEPLQDEEFTTPGPGIEEQSVSNVTATSVTFEASLNSHDAPTSYYFQYGTRTSYESEAPASPGTSLGSENAVLEVAKHVQNLAAGTVYHYRVVVISEPRPGAFETFFGADQTFATQVAGSKLVLPDGRQWEMVSPVDKHGANIISKHESAVIEASINGNAMTYLSDFPTETEPEGYAAHIQGLATRRPGSWEAQEIGIRHRAPAGVALGEGEEYQFFSEDLSFGIVQPLGTFTPALSAEASEQTAFLRANYLNENMSEPCTTSCYRPLATGKAGYANVAPGTVLSGECEERGLEVCGPRFLGATPDGKHVLLGPDTSSASPLLSGGGNLYEWTAGKLTAVGQADLSGGTTGQPVFGSVSSTTHAISNDGTRVVFPGSSEGHLGLLLRDTEKGETVTLDSPQGGAGGPGEGSFQVASSDGSRVFFTDIQPLTADAGAEPAKFSQPARADLYECEIVTVAGKLTCKLSDLTPLTGGEHAEISAVIGASEDGSYVYFVARGALAEGAIGGEPNLYVRHGGVTKLVATLSSSDEPTWNHNALASRVSPDGHWLTFMSLKDLTGYVTRDALSGKPDEEVYLYDAAGTGQLVCASCDPSGARPSGVVAYSAGTAALVNDGGWGEDTLAGNIPGATFFRAGESRYQTRVLSDSGRMFFNSDDALVPQDVNGTEDVYEYEPPGVGDCGSSSTTFSAHANGCVNLISPGISAEESEFLDASGDGGDVFFLTTAKLSARDIDTSYDVYDAHECTAAAPCPPVAAASPPPCDTGDACKASPTPQPAIFGEPSSATFSGAGNIVPAARPKAAIKPKVRGLTRAEKLKRALKACHKRQRKERAVCERQARARYAATGSRKAKTNKRGGR
jgi:hypothetical protein